jgi:hypothetical protein
VDIFPDSCHNDLISGGEASRSKHFTQTLTFFIMAFNFQSTAVRSISDLEDGVVSITFQNGREYNYSVLDPSDFVNQLNLIIESDESVGRFVNQQIRSENLVLV